MRKAVLFLVLAGAIGASARITYAAYTSTTSNPASSFGAKRIFPGNRTLSPRTISDQSSGTASDKSDLLSYDDALVDNTSNWANAYATTRYVDFDLNSPRPTGLSVTSASFDLKFASKGGPGSGNACIAKIEVRRASDNAVLGTIDLTSSPYCSTGTTYRVYNGDISSSVTTTTIANDLRIRVYGYETGAKGWNIGYARVTAVTPYVSFTLYEKRYDDVADTTSLVTTWSLTSVDAVTYSSAQNWPASTPSTSKFVKFVYEPFIPSGATVNTVTFTNVWRSSAAIASPNTLCYYFEVYNGATLIGTHGGNTQATAQSCNASNTSFQTDSVSLPEVDTATKANNLAIRLYYWITSSVCGGMGNPPCVKSVTDQAQVTFNYHLD